jgi:hypothetical protein
MSGRIRTGIYVLGLVRIRSCGSVGEMARSLLGLDRRRQGRLRNPYGRPFPAQSPSCLRSRR